MSPDELDRLRIETLDEAMHRERHLPLWKLPRWPTSMDWVMDTIFFIDYSADEGNSFHIDNHNCLYCKLLRKGSPRQPGLRACTRLACYVLRDPCHPWHARFKLLIQDMLLFRASEDCTELDGWRRFKEELLSHMMRTPPLQLQQWTSALSHCVDCLPDSLLPVIADYMWDPLYQVKRTLQRYVITWFQAERFACPLAPLTDRLSAAEEFTRLAKERWPDPKHCFRHEDRAADGRLMAHYMLYEFVRTGTRTWTAKTIKNGQPMPRPLTVTQEEDGFRFVVELDGVHVSCMSVYRNASHRQ